MSSSWPNRISGVALDDWKLRAFVQLAELDVDVVSAHPSTIGDAPPRPVSYHAGFGMNIELAPVFVGQENFIPHVHFFHNPKAAHNPRPDNWAIVVRPFELLI